MYNSLYAAIYATKCLDFYNQKCPFQQWFPDSCWPNSISDSSKWASGIANFPRSGGASKLDEIGMNLYRPALQLCTKTGLQPKHFSKSGLQKSWVYLYSFLVLVGSLHTAWHRLALLLCQCTRPSWAKPKPSIRMPRSMEVKPLQATARKPGGKWLFCTTWKVDGGISHVLVYHGPLQIATFWEWLAICFHSSACWFKALRSWSNNWDHTSRWDFLESLLEHCRFFWLANVGNKGSGGNTVKRQKNIWVNGESSIFVCKVRRQGLKKSGSPFYSIMMSSGQFITTSAKVTPNGGLVRESPPKMALNQVKHLFHKLPRCLMLCTKFLPLNMTSLTFHILVKLGCFWCRQILSTKTETHRYRIE